ncbi:acetyl-CoA carboxylase, biotin carboxyl carrier protein [Rickettsiella grylli]|uniref:Biotin carboxyl carrier protein of acetyl-CoA carboxylase n=2 Tax=Rickettsiella grylli TaxID=59196 RepID=A8PLX7_9COXI|nr:acetyl-CoA carboxylase, biotin carboxyl carrier protein [Rickettsiella grylli]
MDPEKINQLVKLLDEHGLNEIEFSEGSQTIRIKRDTPLSAQSVPMQSQPSRLNLSMTPTALPASEKAETEDNILVAPVLGTVYLAPSPGAEPFVHLGQSVKKGDTVCIIEAMKMMNHIEAHKDGIIKKRFVENGMPVQYNDSLFIIE